MAGRNPYDRALSDLVGELSTRSDAFRTWWAAHNVRYHHTGTKRLHHPIVGDLDLSYEVMELTAANHKRPATRGHPKLSADCRLVASAATRRPVLLQSAARPEQKRLRILDWLATMPGAS